MERKVDGLAEASRETLSVIRAVGRTLCADKSLLSVYGGRREEGWYRGMISSLAALYRAAGGFFMHTGANVESLRRVSV